MRHMNTGRKFDRNSSNRRAMFRNLVGNLFAHGEIETTVPKAKEVRRIAEKMITKAKRLGSDVNAKDLKPAAVARRLAVKRDVAKFLPKAGERLDANGDPQTLDLVEVLFQEIAPQYLTRPGGYTQIFKTRNRRGDNAEMALIRLVGHTRAAGNGGAAATGGAATTEAVRSGGPKEAR